MTPTDLIARREAATEGSRALSDEVLRGLGWEVSGKDNYFMRPSGTDQWLTARERPDPTQSVDDCIRLMPEGMLFNCGGAADGRTQTARLAWVTIWLDPKNTGEIVDGRAKTPALAFCIALLRAHEAEKEAA